MTSLTQRDVDYIVIHYTATPVESDFSAADIDAMHKRRGWAGIGYHKYIRKNGLIEKGRPLTVRGAHVKGHNHHSIGICYEGGVHAADPNTGLDTRTEAQKEAMTRVIREMLARYPDAQVIGHRDMPGAATQCPGFDAGKWWADVNAGPKKRKSITQSTTIQAAGATGIAGVTGVATAIGQLDQTAQYIVIGSAILAAAGLAWIARERIRKWAAGDK